MGLVQQFYGETNAGLPWPKCWTVASVEGGEVGVGGFVFRVESGSKEFYLFLFNLHKMRIPSGGLHDPHEPDI